ncbi:MAG: hypothetical protein ACOVO2_05245 [Emticicia sp.]|uniref:hypothetical protein n=1 Tax=Emticicia sp. TaxID=1930953 RepID=UPI003BA549DA
MNKLFVLFSLLLCILGCKKKQAAEPQPTGITTTVQKVSYNGPQKDNQYLTKIISTFKNYSYLQKDSLLVNYDVNKKIVNTTNYQFRSGSSSAINRFIKKYETTFNYDSKGNLTDCKTIDLEYQFTATFKFEYDEATNKLNKVNGAYQSGNYSEFITKLEDTDKGFNQLRNGFLRVENTFIDENLSKYFEKDSPITFEYQGYSATKLSPFYALPTNMQKVFYCTENIIQIFNFSIEHLNIMSKNVPSKIISSGTMNTTIDLSCTANQAGYVTEISIGDTSSSFYRKFNFSYNNK